jgi:tetratricopeptide (TPR) repeat protein
MDKEDVFGDVVNVANRLESIAVPGSILVSQETIEKLKIKNAVEFIFLGMQALKGVGRLIEVYAVKGENLVVPSLDDYKDTTVQKHSGNEVPSIAIIPFENKGKDDDVFYSYSISADLISDITSAGLIRVASKKQIDDAGNLSQNELGKTLDVRYIANGELWRRGDDFQLSVELYDTKDKKVVWSDRWQEKWDNLPTIKLNLSDGLLKALDTKPKIVKSVETANSEAYEFYLRAKYKYDKRKNMEDTEVARALYKKAIEVDDELLLAKNELAWSYFETGEYDKALQSYKNNLKQAYEIDDKLGIGKSLGGMGVIYEHTGNYKKALDYHKQALELKKTIGDENEQGITFINIGSIYNNLGESDRSLDYFLQSLSIFEKVDNKIGIGVSLSNIGSVYVDLKNLKKAQEFLEQSIIVYEKIGDKVGITYSLLSLGKVYTDKGDFDNSFDCFTRSMSAAEELEDLYLMGTSLQNLAVIHVNDIDKKLDYNSRALSIFKKLGDKSGIGFMLYNIGFCHKINGDYDNALKHFKESISIFDEIGQKVPLANSHILTGITFNLLGKFERAIKHFNSSYLIQDKIGFNDDDLILNLNTNLFLSYKNLGKSYNEEEIINRIEKVDIDYELNYQLYKLLDNISYLKTAYKQIQEKLKSMENNIKVQFLDYPIPKAIYEEWEIIKNKDKTGE